MTDISKLKLGKQEYEHDPRTMMLAPFLAPEIIAPPRFDFDKGRAPFPTRVWGNDAWGDCVIAGRANHLLRLERVEQRATLGLQDQDAISKYKELTGSSSPGDSRDEGLVILQALRDWRNTGWELPYPKLKSGIKRNYAISAYGELDPQRPSQLRLALYALHGIQFGLWLPVAAQRMTRQGVPWDYNGETTPDFEPGSWGGHLVYSKAYDKDSFEILTWGMKIRMTDRFIAKYCDEAWAVVDNFDSWKVKQTLDVEAMKAKLRQISTLVDL